MHVFVYLFIFSRPLIGLKWECYIVKEVDEFYKGKISAAAENREIKGFVTLGNKHNKTQTSINTLDTTKHLTQQIQNTTNHKPQNTANHKTQQNMKHKRQQNTEKQKQNITKQKYKTLQNKNTKHKKKNHKKKQD